jgi:hypothetical protein
MKVKREDAIQLICHAVENMSETSYEIMLEDNYYDEETDTLPSMTDVLLAVGMTKAEIEIGLKN